MTILVLAALLFGFCRALVVIPNSVQTEADNLLGSTYLKNINTAIYGITVENGGETLVIRPSAKVTAKAFFSAAMPTLKISDAAVQMLTADPLDFDVSNVHINFNAKTVSVVTVSPTPSMQIIPKFMTLSSVGATIVVSHTTTIQLESIALTGIWAIGTTSQVTVNVTKTSASRYAFVGSLTSGQLNVGSFYSAIGETPSKHPALLAIGLGNSVLGSASFIGGVYDTSDNTYGFGFSGVPSTIASWASASKSSVTILYNRDKYDRSAFTVSVTLSSISLATVATKAFGGAVVDISPIPFLGSVIVSKVDFLYSSALVTNQLPDVGSVFASGVGLYTTLRLSSGLIDLNITLDADGWLLFNMKSSPLTFSNFVSAFTTNVKAGSISLPSVFPSILSIDVFAFRYDSSNKTIAVTLSLGGKLDVITNVLSVSNPQLEIRIQLLSPYGVVPVATGTLKIGTSPFTVYIVEDNGNYVVIGRGDSTLKVGDITSQFSTSFLPDGFSNLAAKSKLMTGLIHSPGFSFKLGGSISNYEIDFFGVPLVSNWLGTSFSAVVSNTTSGGSQMAVGYSIVSVNFGTLLKDVTGIGIGALTMVNRNMKASVLISKASMPGLLVPGTSFSATQVSAGITVSASLYLTRCGDPMCVFLSKVIGPGAKIAISSSISVNTMQLTGGFTLTAGIANFAIGHGAMLNQVALQLQIGVPTAIGLIATLTLSDPPLQFSGGINVNLVGELAMSMTMAGMWHNAFGLKFISFGNANLGAIIVPAVGTLASLAVGGTIYIGTNPGKELILKSYAAFNLVMPLGNYFYGKVNHATMASILAAFGVAVSSTSLPPVLAQSGFPNGLESSFALVQTVPVPGVVIPAGYKLNGTINILGFTLSALFYIDLPVGAMGMSIAMTPLNLAGGLIRMYRSATETTHGPTLNASFVLSPLKISVFASGYLDLLYGLIKVESQLEITNTQFLFKLEYAPFFGFAAESLTVAASYGSLSTAAFRVAGSLSIQWPHQIEVLVIAAIQTSATKATSAINSAKAKVTAAEGKVTAAQNKVNSAKSAFTNANAGLTNAQNKVNSLCSIQNCGQSK